MMCLNLLQIITYDSVVMSSHSVVYLGLFAHGVVGCRDKLHCIAAPGSCCVRAKLDSPLLGRGARGPAGCPCASPRRRRRAWRCSGLVPVLLYMVSG